MTETVKEAFVVLCDLADAVGAKQPLSEYAGCWEHKIDEKWFVACNAHQEPKAVVGIPGGMAHGGKPFMLDPFHAYVEYNGWTAGVFNPRNGTFAAGSGANEDTFIAAVLAAIAKTRATQ